ncbi:uncharacterized protein LOC112041432 [Lingula anatina]|uniref:Uncharacterized protein LOC112041432 n=1 Tax=Lingula anatina TaxID=7574 RepID=A0A2R2MJM6_LINAN|nr:uncharacterized protein LOC112041432 [Lingula anatina]|eukprot:XP_023930403.1 uncharacterized protein LOC112041432 [Lingula anatina]
MRRKMGQSESVCNNGHYHPTEADAERCNNRRRSRCASGHWHKNGNEASECDEREGRRCVSFGNGGKVHYNEFAVGKTPKVRQALRNWDVSRALQYPY